MKNTTKIGVAIAAAAAMLLAAGCSTTNPQGDYCVKPVAKVNSCKGMNSCKGTVSTSK